MKVCYNMRRDEIFVLPEGTTSKAAGEKSNGLEDEARANFNKDGLLLDLGVGVCVIDDLVIPKPDPLVEIEKRKDVIDERLRPRVPSRTAKGLNGKKTVFDFVCMENLNKAM